MTLSEQFMQWALNQGVAVGILLYFIFRFERILKDNTTALTQLQSIIHGRRLDGNSK